MAEQNQRQVLAPPKRVLPRWVVGANPLLASVAVVIITLVGLVAVTFWPAEVSQRGLYPSPVQAPLSQVEPLLPTNAAPEFGLVPSELSSRTLSLQVLTNVTPRDLAMRHFESELMETRAAFLKALLGGYESAERSALELDKNGAVLWQASHTETGKPVYDDMVSSLFSVTGAPKTQQNLPLITNAWWGLAALRSIPAQQANEEVRVAQSLVAQSQVELEEGLSQQPARPPSEPNPTQGVYSPTPSSPAAQATVSTLQPAVAIVQVPGDKPGISAASVVWTLQSIAAQKPQPETTLPYQVKDIVLTSEIPGTPWKTYNVLFTTCQESVMTFSDLDRYNTGWDLVQRVRGSSYGNWTCSQPNGVGTWFTATLVSADPPFSIGQWTSMSNVWAMLSGQK